MSTVTRYYKISLIVFSAIVIGFTVFKIVTFEVQPPRFYPIGVATNNIIPAFEEAGFRFKPTDPAYGQEQIIGFSEDQKTFIQLVGDDELVTVKIVATLSKDTPKSKLHEVRGHFYRMIKQVLPHWKAGNHWLEDKTLAIGNSGLRRTTIGDVEVTVRVESDNNTWGLAFGDWTTLPPYEGDKWGWEETRK